MNTKNSEGLTKYRIRVNYIDADGKYKQLTRVAYGMKNARAMEAKLTEECQNLDQDINLSDDLTFREFHEIYVSNMSCEIRPTTMQKKMQNFRIHIDPYVGHIKLKELSSRILAVWKATINKKDLSLQTRKSIYKELHATLEYAIKLDYIEKNPLKKNRKF